MGCCDMGDDKTPVEPIGTLADEDEPLRSNPSELCPRACGWPPYGMGEEEWWWLC